MAKSPREYHLLYTYGITLDQYNDLLEKQDYKCNVCGRPETEFKTRLAVDHNHETMEIRGLLCNHCNRRVVGRHKNSWLFRRAADHMDNHTGLFVPRKKKSRTKTSRRGKRILIPPVPRKPRIRGKDKT